MASKQGHEGRTGRDEGSSRKATNRKRDEGRRGERERKLKKDRMERGVRSAVRRDKKRKEKPDGGEMFCFLEKCK